MRSLFLMAALGGCLDYDLGKLQDELPDWCDTASGDDCGDDQQSGGDSGGQGSDSGGQGSDPPAEVEETCTDLGEEPWGAVFATSGGDQWWLWTCDDCATVVGGYDESGPVEIAALCLEQNLLTAALERCQVENSVQVNTQEVINFLCN